MKANTTSIQFLTPVLLSLAVLAIFPACGAGEAQRIAMEKQIVSLEQRIHELERDSGRSKVRVEDVEDRLNLMTDRVETNRIALERRGIARALPVVVAQPNGATGLGSPPAYRPPAQPADPYKGVAGNRIRTRISVPGTGARERRIDYRDYGDDGDRGAYERVTITEDDFRRFSGDDVRPAPRARSARSATRTPKAPVTSEKLTLGKEAAKAESTSKPNLSARDTYKTALASYRSGNYSKAFGEFEAYLGMNPPQDYLDNAYYWLGECSFGAGKYQEAIKYFDKVMKETPGGNKVPDSMLKASIAYSRLGRKSDAKSILSNLVETYPSTNAAKLAADKLKEFE